MTSQQHRQTSSQSTTPYYPLLAHNHKEIQYSTTPDATILGQFPFQGLDLPLDYEPYPETGRGDFGEVSHHPVHRLQQHSQPTDPGIIYGATTFTSPQLQNGKGQAKPTTAIPGPKDESHEKKVHRRMQNRLSQRAYRSRKDKLIETLQLKIDAQIGSRKRMAEACNKKIDSCIDVLHTQVNELKALQTVLMGTMPVPEDGGSRDDVDDVMNMERESSMDTNEGLELGLEFDASAWGYQF
ncbi:uncharacterized protein LY89DRAFT_736827 [Mollisia scopiformis]|uniref:BZIP domain-containing protein n=1 Tax=Mollisia scopiformis TaxID=149040 RepID=A0A194X0W7_MOLSC|nr:uncharacterized protein LY89DRAFT_736827 [Mollisia scopiformis]KUJ13830.1 hypothetical protein LY89DRAFT_736827 [Mollisia scopiformis]